MRVIYLLIRRKYMFSYKETRLDYTTPHHTTLTRIHPSIHLRTDPSSSIDILERERERERGKENI